jgi:hypothetical protein
MPIVQSGANRPNQACRRNRILELADFAGVWQSFMVRPCKPTYIWWIEFRLGMRIAITDREP